MAGPMNLPEPQRSAWIAGAEAEAKARDGAIRAEAWQVVSCAQQLGEHRRYGDDADIAAWLAKVFTVEWPMRRRLALAWDIARPFRPAEKIKPAVQRHAMTGLVITLAVLAGMALWAVTA